MTLQPGAGRAMGWLLAGAAAAALVSGAAALALAADRPEPVVTLDLGLLPASAPALSAMAAPAPKVVDKAFAPPAEPDLSESAPEVPDPSVAPAEAEAPAMAAPATEAPVVADLALPEKPTPKPKPKRTEAKPVKEETRKKAKPKPVTDPGETAVAASAPASTAKGTGGLSPKAYAKAVMKKVRATRKAAGAGRGTAVVGFSIAADGGLAGVTLLQSSGDAGLDKVALDHIRRAAPFPPPPDGAGRDYSFEFEGR